MAAGVLSSVVVACVTFTQGHNKSEASSQRRDLNLVGHPHLIDHTETEGKEHVIKKEEETEVKEVNVRMDMEVEMKEDQVEVEKSELEWKEDEDFFPVDASSLGASLASLRRFLHHAKRIRCCTSIHSLVFVS